MHPPNLAVDDPTRKPDGLLDGQLQHRWINIIARFIWSLLPDQHQESRLSVLLPKTVLATRRRPATQQAPVSLLPLVEYLSLFNASTGFANLILHQAALPPYTLRPARCNCCNSALHIQPPERTPDVHFHDPPKSLPAIH